MEDKTIQDIFSLMETFHAKNDHDICKSYFLTLCNYTMTNPFLAHLIRNPRGNSFFEKTMTMFHQYVTNIVQDASSPQQNKTEYSYMIASAIGSTLGVLHKWTRENFYTPPDDIAEIMTKIFISGILPFMQ